MLTYPCKIFGKKTDAQNNASRPISSEFSGVILNEDDIPAKYSGPIYTSVDIRTQRNRIGMMDKKPPLSFSDCEINMSIQRKKTNSCLKFKLFTYDNISCDKMSLCYK